MAGGWTRPIRRLGAVGLFAASGLRRTSGVLNWWPTVLAVLSAVGAVVGLAIPKHVGGLWLAIAGLAGMAIVLFVAAYRLHKIAFPDFPRHKLDLGNPWIAPDPTDEGQMLLLMEVTFHNREPRRKVHLDVDIYWKLTLGRGRELGPYSLSHYVRGRLGTLKLLTRPAVVDHEGLADGYAVFSLALLPIKKEWLEEHSKDSHSFIVPEEFDFEVRLTDDLSGAEERFPLSVLRPAKEKEEEKELAREVRRTLLRRVLRMARRQPQ
jgi:hypothetical protein